MKYIILDKKFCKENAGTKEDGNIFSFAVTNENQFVIPNESKKEFKKLLKGEDLTNVVELTNKDFENDSEAPGSDGNGLLVPNRFEWIFPIIVSEFKIELKVFNNQKFVEKSILSWKSLFRYLNEDNNKDLNNLLDPFFKYLKNNATEIKIN